MFNLERRLSSLSLSAADPSANSAALYGIVEELRAAEPGSLQRVLTSSDVRALFAVWDRLDEDCQQLAGQLFAVLLDKCSAHFVLSHFAVEIQSSLATGSPPLRQTILDRVTASIKSNESLVRDLSPDASSSLCLAIMKCFADAHHSVADSARQALMAIAAGPGGVPLIFSNRSAVEILKSMTQLSGSIRIRIYDLVGSLTALSDDNLKYCLEEGFMDVLLEDIKSEDLLQQINVLEVLTDLAFQSPAMLQHMQNLGVLRIVQDLIVSSQQDPDGGLLHHAAVKFFGCFARLYPKECLQAFPQYLDLIFGYVFTFKTANIALRLLAFDTVAMIGYTGDGKRLLSKCDDKMTDCMRSFGRVINDPPLEARIRHIDALRDLFTTELPQEGEEFSELIKKWWHLVYDGRTMECFFKLLKQPIPTLQMAVFRLLQTIASFDWFPAEVKAIDGFVDWIVLRDHAVPDIQHMKYELIQQIMFNPATKAQLDPKEQMQLMEYVRRGPLLTVGVVDVATE